MTSTIPLAAAQDSSSLARRIEFLDGVRGAAVAVVVLHHTLADVYPDYAAFSAAYLDLGRVGVVAFFLVSGYVIPLSLARQDLRQFAIRRAFRLFPLYWAALVLLAAVQADAVSGYPPHVLALNLLMLQGLVGATSVLAVAWTLSIELLFYVQSAVAARRGALDRAVHAGWGWLALYAAMAAVEGVAAVDLPTTLPLLMAVAAIGQALSRRDLAGATSWRALLVGVTVVVPLGAVVGGGTGEWQPLPYSTSFLCGLVMFAAFYVWRHKPVPVALLWLGSISYSLYLLHGPVHRFVDLLGVDGPVLIGLSLLCATAVSVLGHRVVERPAQELGRRLSSRSRPVTTVG